MKLLIVCQYYAPEPFQITGICEELAERGHDVTVLTGMPNYPMGKIYEGYRHGERTDERLNGVTIHRCREIGRHGGIVRRVINYYSFSISSTRYAARLDEDYDAVLVYQLSPVMMARAGIRYKKRHNKKLVLYCLDLWPESLITGGVRRNSPLYRLYRHVSARIYRQADRILISSQSFAEYFHDTFGLSDTTYLPQYAETFFSPDACRKKPGRTVDLMFAGNIGTAQSVGTIVRTAALLKDVPDLRFHIVGDGSDAGRVRQLAAALKVQSVIFHGWHSPQEMPSYYAMADAMLVTMQKDSVLSRTLPGKVQTYLAAGKPILGAVEGETSRLITETQCGYCAPAENAEELARICRQFVAGRSEWESLGERSAAVYRERFTKKQFIDTLEKILGEACS